MLLSGPFRRRPLIEPTGFEHDVLAPSSALRKSPRNATSRQAGGESQNREQGRQIAGMESRRSYSGIDAPEVIRDCQKMDKECVAFETDYTRQACGTRRQGRCGRWLAEAVRRYEAIDDLAGRLGSYAVLIHAGDSVDPRSQSFTATFRADDRGIGASVVFRARTQSR